MGGVPEDSKYNRVGVPCDGLADTDDDGLTEAETDALGEVDAEGEMDVDGDNDGLTLELGADSSYVGYGWPE